MTEKIVIKIDDNWFDMTDFAIEHPGGAKLLKLYNGKDATEAFNRVRAHCDTHVYHLMDKYCVQPK